MITCGSTAGEVRCADAVQIVTKKKIDTYIYLDDQSPL